MSLSLPSPPAALKPSASLTDSGDNLGDRHQRLLEAGMLDCCPDGDLLALMPSVDRPELPWVDGRAWIVRILGF